MQAERDSDRQILAISGADRLDFLQGLVTNDVALLDQGAVYAALLTPQGKYLADFFLVADGDRVLLDVHRSLGPGLVQRLSMYKLRADVAIAPVEMAVWRGLDDAPGEAVADPRDPLMGWRYYGDLVADEVEFDWDAVRVAAGVPETGVELLPNDSYILEMDFERLAGVDFKKGCYVGQEVTARMKHKTELRKGLTRVEVNGTTPVGTEIQVGERKVGTLYTQADGMGLAYLRFDRAAPSMGAGDAVLRWHKRG